MEKTAEQIREDLKTRIAYDNPKIDLVSGNVTTDIGVDAFSDELAALYTEQDRIRRLYLLDATAFSSDEADKLGSSYGIYRLAATRATGVVRFGAAERPESGQVFTIPVGTTVTTSGESTGIKTYVTVTPGYITSTTTLNPSTNYYECTVTVQAQAEGIGSNVAAGAINQIKGSVSGVSVVYNPTAITNGTEEETTEELIERIRLRLRGTVFGTVASYLAKVYEDPNVKDAVVVDPDNEFSVRGPGTIDIYLLGSIDAPFTQEVTPTYGAYTVYFTKSPVNIDHDVVVTLPDGRSFSNGSVFNVYLDKTSIYTSSTRSKDKLVWDKDFFDENIRDLNKYTIDYTYNKLVNDVQETFDSEENRIVTADVLIRTTHQLDAAMDFDIVTLPGYDSLSVRNSVKYAIETFVNDFKLNQTLRQSDIIGLVENTEGVDYVKFPMRRFSLKNAEGVEDIESSPLEYIRISAEDIILG